MASRSTVDFHVRFGALFSFSGLTGSTLRLAGVLSQVIFTSVFSLAGGGRAVPAPVFAAQDQRRPMSLRQMVMIKIDTVRDVLDAKR